MGPEAGDVESGTGCWQVTEAQTLHTAGDFAQATSSLGLGGFLLKIISMSIASRGEKWSQHRIMHLRYLSKDRFTKR